MSVTRGELKEYLGPALSRKTFRFCRLRGLVREGTLQSLRFARAFSHPENLHAGSAQPRRSRRGAEIMRELSKTEPWLRLPVMDALRKLSGGAGPGGHASPSARMEAMERIQETLLDCGVHAVFGKPASAGLMLHAREAAGIPLRLYLGESFGDKLGRGRLNRHPGGSWSLEVDVTQTAARLMQAVEYWLADFRLPLPHLDMQRLSFVRAPRELLKKNLAECMERGRVAGEHVPVMFALDVSCLRLINDQLECIASGSATPQDFLMRALNASMDSVLAHEIAHLQERRASGFAALHPMAKETLAYLLQAAYSEPADAFRGMMMRGFDITLMMPAFDAALRAMGSHAFCLERGYLRGWARGMLDEFEKLCGFGTGAKPAIGTDAITNAQTNDYITEGDLPLIERALCNPNLRTKYAPISLPDADS
ncbi:hypothetical protein L0Y65_03205 [Candidatus Micrarchaeota archaeon]|nr:hypothetical protein [Candidatus Micrarchaeota archaeon]